MIVSKSRLSHLPMLVLAAVAALIGSGTATFSDLLWQPYVDPALGYSVLYPSGLFELPPVHEHGGLTLSSRSGAKLFIFGGPNPQGRSPEVTANQLSKVADVYQVTYRKLTQSWLVLSGYLTDGPRGTPQSIFYERIDFPRDRQTLAGFRLVYSPAQRAIFDPLIATIGNSLRPPISGTASLAVPAYPPPPDVGRTPLTHEAWCRRNYSTYDATTDTFLRFDGERVPCAGRAE